MDSLVVPRRLRRGVPVDLLEQWRGGLTRREPWTGAESYVSIPTRAARLSDGTIALVHYDPNFDVRASRPATADVWLTVVDRTFERACVDARLPMAEASLPSLAFRGDTVFVPEHAIANVRDVPALQAYTISAAECAWLPVGRG